MTHYNERSRRRHRKHAACCESVAGFPGMIIPWVRARIIQHASWSSPTRRLHETKDHAARGRIQLVGHPRAFGARETLALATAGPRFGCPCGWPYAHPPGPYASRKLLASALRAFHGSQRWMKSKTRPGWISAEQYAEFPDELTVREVLVDGQVLVTTLLNQRQVRKSALDQLYAQRRNVELNLRNLKTTLGVEVLRWMPTFIRGS